MGSQRSEMGRGPGHPETLLGPPDQGSAAEPSGRQPFQQGRGLQGTHSVWTAVCGAHAEDSHRGEKEKDQILARPRKGRTTKAATGLKRRQSRTPGSQRRPSRGAPGVQQGGKQESSGQLAAPVSERGTRVQQDREPEDTETTGSPVRDVLSVRRLWDIPGDMSRKEMARNAGLDLREEVRPEQTTLRTAIASAEEQGGRASRGTGAQGEEGREARSHGAHGSPHSLKAPLRQPVTSALPDCGGSGQWAGVTGPEGTRDTRHGVYISVAAGVSDC